MFKRLKNFTISVYQNYFEIASCLGATTIILLAILMDNILGLQACPMCIMTRYVFGIIAVISFFGFIAKKLFLIDKFLIVLASMAGLAVTGKQIYLQNLSQEEISNLPMGCGMPLETQIEYFGFFGGIANASRARGNAFHGILTKVPMSGFIIAVIRSPTSVSWDAPNASSVR